MASGSRPSKRTLEAYKLESKVRPYQYRAVHLLTFRCAGRERSHRPPRGRLRPATLLASLYDVAPGIRCGAARKDDGSRQEESAFLDAQGTDRSDPSGAQARADTKNHSRGNARLVHEQRENSSRTRQGKGNTNIIDNEHPDGKRHADRPRVHERGKGPPPTHRTSCPSSRPHPTAIARRSPSHHADDDPPTDGDAIALGESVPWDASVLGAGRGAWREEWRVCSGVCREWGWCEGGGGPGEKEERWRVCERSDAVILWARSCISDSRRQRLLSG